MARPEDPPDARFRLMDPAEQAAFVARDRAAYVAERVAAGDDPASAEANADRAYAAAFPGGRPAGGHAVFVVEEAGEAVGSLWLGPSRDGPAQWWVYAVEVDRAHRRRGLGRAAMVHAERVARVAGATSIGLNVFVTNPDAQRLYRSLGYEVTASSAIGTNMAKSLI
jgi:ribosomal protein S18 acetylase RimI-like enzyme